MGAQGTATLDFGAAPGTTITTVSVADVAILAGSHAEAFLMGDSTVAGALGHNAEEHQIFDCKLTCKVTAGVGFAITAVSLIGRMTSTFTVRWVWN